MLERINSPTAQNAVGLGVRLAGFLLSARSGHRESFLENLEYAICDWFIARNPVNADALKSQLLGAEVTHREFTNGGGVFVGLQPAALVAPMKGLIASGCFAIDGPEIHSIELEACASTTLFFDPSGFVDHIEIFAHCSDCPTERHPLGTSLHAGVQTVIDLQPPKSPILR